MDNGINRSDIEAYSKNEDEFDKVPESNALQLANEYVQGCNFGSSCHPNWSLGLHSIPDNFSMHCHIAANNHSMENNPT